MTAYHDAEWGVSLHDDKKLFEFLILESFQAGLSWKTILYKRDNFRKAFDNFDIKKISLYDDRKIHTLLNDRGIIRNRLKICAAIKNARLIINIKETYGSFDAYIWNCVPGLPLQNAWKHVSNIPARTKESDFMSICLKKYGFQFIGSTTCYAFMQAIGMVNDHTIDCFRYKEVCESRSVSNK